MDVDGTLQQDATAEQTEDAKEDAVPSKYVEQETIVDVRCSVKYIDFEGLSDGKSIGLILQRVAPKKLV